jgi:hypothetical protein
MTCPHWSIALHSAGNFDVGFVDEPAIAWSVPAGPSRVDEQRYEPLHPAVDGHVSQVLFIHRVLTCVDGSSGQYDPRLPGVPGALLGEG